MTPRAPQVTVIVPTFRRAELLRRCLAGLDEQSRPADQVVVVTRGGDDRTLAALRGVQASGVLHGRLDVVEVTSPGVIAALEAGFAVATGDLIALTDDDAVPRPDWIGSLLAHYDDPQVACVGGRDDQSDTGSSARQVGVLQPWGRLVGEHHRGVGAARQVDHLRGVNMSLRRRWARVDQRLRGAGAQYAWELDICLPARRAGAVVIYDPQIVVEHGHGPRFDADLRDEPPFLARVDRVHNETYLLLKWLPVGRALAVFGYGLIVGTRFAPGPLLVVEQLARRPSAGAGRSMTTVAERAVAGFGGRILALVTLARVSRDPDWRRATGR